MSSSASHAGHSHGVGTQTQQRWLVIALAINVAFLCAEVVAGILANSLALLSDAAHMLTDVAAIALALAAVALADRPPTGRFTFGLKRSEILSAQINGVALVALATVIGFEAIRRILEPPDVDGAFVVVTGLVGAVANGGAAWALARANRQSLNVEGAFLHNLYDLYSSLAAAAAGAAVLLWSFDQADGIAALTVAALMVVGGIRLLIDSGRVLMEGTPSGMDADQIGNALAGADGVVEVHDLHVWEVTSGFPALAAHVIVEPDADCHAKRRELDELLHDRFEIAHTTLQVDHATRGGLLNIERPAGGG